MPNRIGFRRFIDAKKQITPFKFDPTLVTFTAGISKRNSAGPFAAGVMVQGNRTDTAGTTGDIVQLTSNAAQISANGSTGFFYNVLDEYQGSIVFWITPEWNGNDGLQHTVFGSPLNINRFLIEKTATNILRLLVNGSLYGSIDTSANNWIAGTTYNVVFRWDKNTIDGLNYGSCSINDVTTFNNSSNPANPGSVGVLNIGNYNNLNALNALLEGFTIFRRVLFDGSYGTDVGNGDEIALIYNAGTGKDPCEITGSWDVTFCLPTDSDTSTALVTG